MEQERPGFGSKSAWAVTSYWTPSFGNGYFYEVSPYYLVNNFGKYYLICNTDKYDDHSNFRLDYTSNIELTDNDIKPIENVKTLGKNFNINKHINDHVYMFGGNIITAKILVKKDYGIK